MRRRMGPLAAVLAATVLLLVAGCAQPQFGNCEPGVGGIGQDMAAVPKSC